MSQAQLISKQISRALLIVLLAGIIRAMKTEWRQSGDDWGMPGALPPSPVKKVSLVV